MATEVRLFGLLSLYGLIVGSIYWFSSYEAAGTALLLGFGITTGTAFVVLLRGQPGRRPVPDSDDDPYPGRPDGPFGDESAPVPTRSTAPLVLGFGVAVMALAGAFGPWFLIMGVIPVLIGSVDWLRSAARELRQRDRAEARAAAEQADGSPHSEGGSPDRRH
jgi:Cytochrome c oxidase subunit IV